MVEENEVFIVAAARTPIGSFNGTLSKIKASDLGSVVINAVIKRANINNDDVDEVIVGQALTAGQGQNPARQAAISAGLSVNIPAYSINMLCGSGLKSIVLGYQSIRCGDSKVVISGGQENMSLAPHAIHLRQGLKMGPGEMCDTMLHDGLTDAMNNIHMGITAENLVKEYNITRYEQDEYAIRSQNLAEEAQSKGYFDDEIVPIEIKDRKGMKLFSKDEFIKSGAKLEQIQHLKPCFISNGTVTPANASGINDSAAAVLLMSGGEMERKKIIPMAKVVAWSQTGVEPTIMGIGPVSAVEIVLSKTGWLKSDVDLFELNEAFAGQALAVLKALNVEPSKVNVNGGAIALGHPIGASGARILVTLLYALKRINGKRGIASLCIGGGMGIAIAIEIM